ncbi:hypothetical protein POG22_08765 [Geitlerinema sp. CS-897]|nr:hypothetical protein [Geitlerinema sp. CS-897]
MLHIINKLPFGDRYAAPRYFKRWVADPIPQYLSNFRGGYQGGLFKGFILISFNYRPPFERDGFPEGYISKNPKTDAASRTLKIFINLLLKETLTLTKTYFKPSHPSGGGSTFIFIDDTVHRGVFYEAIYFPFLQ